MLICCINNVLNSYNSGDKKRLLSFQKLVWLHRRGGGGKGWQVVVVYVHNTQTEPWSP